MNDDIQALLGLDWVALIFGIFIVMSGVIAMFTIIGKFSEIIGKPVKWVRNKQKDHELIIENAKAIQELSKRHEEDTKQSIRHDEIIRNDLKQVSETVNEIAIKLNDMEKRDNETKIKELKDTLINYYNKYRVIGEWSKLEKDAFWELFEDYESRGGDGYIHSVVEPVMRELKDID